MRKSIVVSLVIMLCVAVILPFVNYRNEHNSAAMLGFSALEEYYETYYGFEKIESLIEPFSTVTYSWALNHINAPATWGITTGSPAIYVAVIDSGIQANHRSLTNVVCRVRSKDFDTRRNAPLVDGSGHGTRVAGLISAQNSGRRTAVAQNIRLVSFRVGIGNSSTANWEWVAQAIRHASVLNIPIINLSLGNVRNDIPNTSFANLRSALEDFEGFIVTSAGNDLRNNDNPRHRVYPAGFAYRGYEGFDNLISVGASMETNRKTFLSNSSGSNYGRNSVDVFAPGHRMITTTQTGMYTAAQSHGLAGTSWAAPLVTGTAALMLSVAPHLVQRPYLVRQIIMDTVTQHSRFQNYSVSGGWINTHMAVMQAMQVREYPPNAWTKPVWESATNSHGTVTWSGGSGSSIRPYTLFNPVGGAWIKQAHSGWVQLTLNYSIIVHQITVLSAMSIGTIYFTGTNGALGSPVPSFGFASRVTVDVGGIRTNVIRFNKTDIPEPLIMVASIRIYATYCDREAWQQPTWTSATNEHGTIVSSGNSASNYAWNAFNGSMAQWQTSGSGWLELRLNEYIYVDRIEINTGLTFFATRGHFSGSGDVPLGNQFTRIGEGRTIVDVGGVKTNLIRLDISATAVIVRSIVIHATV